MKTDIDKTREKLKELQKMLSDRQGKTLTRKLFEIKNEDR